MKLKIRVDLVLALKTDTLIEQRLWPRPTRLAIVAVAHVAARTDGMLGRFRLSSSAAIASVGTSLVGLIGRSNSASRRHSHNRDSGCGYVAL